MGYKALRTSQNESIDWWKPVFCKSSHFELIWQKLIRWLENLSRYTLHFSLATHKHVFIHVNMSRTHFKNDYQTRELYIADQVHANPTYFQKNQAHVVDHTCFQAALFILSRKLFNAAFLSEFLQHFPSIQLFKLHFHSLNAICNLLSGLFFVTIKFRSSNRKPIPLINILEYHLSLLLI